MQYQCILIISTGFREFRTFAVHLALFVPEIRVACDRIHRQTPTERTYWHSFLITVVQFGCCEKSDPSSTDPASVSKSDCARGVLQLPRHAEIDFSQVDFMHARLDPMPKIKMRRFYLKNLLCIPFSLSAASQSRFRNSVDLNTRRLCGPFGHPSMHSLDLGAARQISSKSLSQNAAHGSPTPQSGCFSGWIFSELHESTQLKLGSFGSRNCIKNVSPKIDGNLDPEDAVMPHEAKIPIRLRQAPSETWREFRGQSCSHLTGPT